VYECVHVAGMAETTHKREGYFKAKIDANEVTRSSEYNIIINNYF
jgi:hypothetical protein